MDGVQGVDKKIAILASYKFHFMIIWCKIQVIINRLLLISLFKILRKTTFVLEIVRTCRVPVVMIYPIPLTWTRCLSAFYEAAVFSKKVTDVFLIF